MLGINARVGVFFFMRARANIPDNVKVPNIVARIKSDARNYRFHTEENKALIHKSLTKLGAGRSVLASSDGVCLAGNGVLEQAQKLKIPLKIVETEGEVLVVVQRKDIKSGSKKAQELALADNAVADTSAGAWTREFIDEDFKEEDLQSWNVNLTDKSLLDELESGLLQNSINQGSDIFSITFNFPKEFEEPVKRVLKSVDRATMQKQILDLILGVENNA